MTFHFNNPLKFKCIYHGGNTISPSDINEGVDNFSIFLDKHTKNKPKNIYLKLENNIASIVAFFSILKTGSNVIIINPDLGEFEFKDCKYSCPGDYLLTPPSSFKNVNWSNYIEPISENIDTLRPTPNSHIIAFSNAIDGYPAASILTWENLISCTKSFVKGTKLNETSTVIPNLPLYHLYGLQGGLLCPLAAHCSFYLENRIELLSVKKAQIASSLHQDIHLYSIPAYYHLLQDKASKNFNLKNFNIMVSGGYKLPQSIADSFFKSTGRYLNQGYGLTEAGPVVSCNYEPNKSNYLSVGKPIEGVKAKEFKSNSSKGNVIKIKSKGIFKGYWNNLKKDNERLNGGWLNTYDHGYIKNGFIYIEAPPDNMYLKLGHNLFSREIERLIKMHPLVNQAKIEKCSSNEGGDIIKATIYLKNNSTLSPIQLKKWLRSEISSYKIPQIIDIIDFNNERSDS